MTSNSPRRNYGPGNPEVYWRRRVFALAGGLATLGLLAWACSGATGSTAGGQAATSATASPAGAQPAASPTVTPSASATASPASRASRAAHSPGSAHRRAAAPARSARRNGYCAPRDLVLTLLGSGTSFQSGDRPRFQVDVVDVGSRGCTFDAGSRSLNLVIMSGTDRIWGSADCSHVRASAPVRLQRGVPHTASFTWDESRSAPGCRAARTAARPGTYTATGYGGGATTRTDVFTLR